MGNDSGATILAMAQKSESCETQCSMCRVRCRDGTAQSVDAVALSSFLTSPHMLICRPPPSPPSSTPLERLDSALAIRRRRLHN